MKHVVNVIVACILQIADFSGDQYQTGYFKVLLLYRCDQAARQHQGLLLCPIPQLKDALFLVADDCNEWNCQGQGQL